MCVCVFSIEIQTERLILVKFGISTGIFFDGGKVLSWVLTPYPDPQGQGPPKWEQGCLNHAIWQKIYKSKVVGPTCLSWDRLYFLAHNLDLEGPGPHVLLEQWSIIFRQSL